MCALVIFFITRLGRAAFCMEELILTNPHHYLYHLKYAEVSAVGWDIGLNVSFRFVTALSALNWQENTMQQQSS